MTTHARLKRSVFMFGIVLVILTSGASAQSQRASPPTRLFVFDSPFWLNLHQFLYVLGRAQGKLPNSDRRAVVNAPGDESEGLKSLTPDQQQVWQRAVDVYASGPSRLDAVFDQPLVELAGLLIAIDKRPSLDGIGGVDPAIANALNSAAPIYRTVWWPRDVLTLETVFHEAMHQWDDQVFQELRAHAQKRNVQVPPDLSHAMIFFTAGEAVKSVVPAHVPYAESEGVWNRSMGKFRPALEAVWLPYLRGSGTRERAMAALIEKTAVSR